MKIEEILKKKGHKVVTTVPGSLLLDTMRLLVRENIGCVVVAEAGRIQGILTERDVLRCAARDPDALRSLATADVMTRTVLVAELDDPVPWVMETLVRRRFRHLPVVKDGLLAGIVSQGDVVNTFLEHLKTETRHLREYVRLFLGGPSPPHGSTAGRRGKGSPRPNGESTGMTASDILRSKGEEVVSVPPATPILTAMRAMTDHDIGSVLVAGDGRFHGILTERDVLRAGAHDLESFHRRQVQELMSRNLIMATPDDSLSAMLSVMVRKRIRHLPIVRDGALEGIVSMGDLVAALVRVAEAEKKALQDRIQGKSSGLG